MQTISRRPRLRAGFGLGSALAGLLVLGSLVATREPLVVVLFVFLLVVPFEKMFPRHRGQRIRRPGVGTDVAYALAGPALGVATLAVAVVVGIASLAWLPGLAIRPLVAMLPAAALPFVGIALFDLATYWVHRWSHEVPLLWRFHAIHHSTERLDWVSGFRNHPLDGAILAPPFVFLLAAGFDAVFTGVLAAVQLVTGLFLHANVRWRWRWLHRIVITPEFHHWHHANETDAINTNYSVFLPLWDIVFGTYYMPRTVRPLRYGVAEDVPDGMLAQLRHPFRREVERPGGRLRRGRSIVHEVVAGVVRSTRRSRRVPPEVGQPHRWARRPPTVDV
ncbi:MAG: sterol desaturase family protein [Actinomycetota bacterium]